MLITPKKIFGTIGGGNLEYLVIKESILMLKNELKRKKLKVPIGLNVEHIMSYNFQLSVEMLQELARIYREFCIKSNHY